MSQSLITKIRGLYTFPNDFSSVPDGALAVADNVVIDRDSIAEPRRGFTYLASAAGRADFVDAGDRAQKIFFYDDTIIAQVLTGSTYSLVYFNPTTGFATIDASFNPPAATVKTRSAQAKQNLYLTSDDGVYRIDDRDSTPVRVGIPEPLEIGPILSLSGTNWLTNNYSVAYRFVLCFKDENGNLYQSSPSGRAVYTNTTGGPISTQFNIFFPPGLTTSHFYQVYRSFSVSTATPSDDMSLIAEKYLTSGMLSATRPTDLFYDNVPESLFGAALYTNSSQETIDNANSIPPYALDIAWYKEFMFYANVKYQQIYYLSLKNVTDFVAESYPGTPPSSITIDGVKIWALNATGNPWASEPYFLIIRTGGLTAAQYVELTTKNIVAAICKYCTGVYATYISTPDTDPGQIVIKSYSVNRATFPVISTLSTCWIPPLPTSGITQSSTADESPNGIAFSKYLQPEHVPLQNFLPAGSKESAILRIIPLRDSLFILKEDGVYRLWGTDGLNWQIALLDSTANIVGPDTACVLNNMIFALTTQGVVTISETGVTIMSRPIEANLLDLLQTNKSVLSLHSFAFASESQRAYYLYLPTTSADTRPTQYYRYNTITNNWTHGTLAKNCGGVNPVDDLIYLGDPDDKYLDVERKTKTIYDYSDYIETETVSSVSNKTVTITNASIYSIGQIIAQFPAFVVQTVAMGAGGGFNETTNEITKNTHGYFTGTQIALTAPAALPVGLSARTYWVIKTGANTFKLADTYDLAIAGTPIDFTDQGTIANNATFTPSNSIIWGTITAVGSTTLDVAYKCKFTLSTALLLAPIAAEMKWVPATFQNPGMNKQVREVTLMFLADFYGTAEVSFATDASPTTLYETISGSYPAPWGNFPWGSAPYGGILRRRPVRVMVPRIHQRGSFLSIGFSHEVAFSPWAIQGISIIGNNISEKVWHQGNNP